MEADFNVVITYAMALEKYVHFKNVTFHNIRIFRYTNFSLAVTKFRIFSGKKILLRRDTYYSAEGWHLSKMVKQLSTSVWFCSDRTHTTWQPGRCFLSHNIGEHRIRQIQQPSRRIYLVHTDSISGTCVCICICICIQYRAG